jgi:hypothetical protein
VIIDPQQLKTYLTYAEIERMIETSKYTGFTLPFKRASQVRKLKETEISVRKSTSSQRNNKRRRLQGGKTRKDKKRK